MRIPKRATAGASAAALAAALAVIAAPAPGAAAACRPDAGDLLLTYQPIDHTVADAQYVRARLTLANRDRRCGLKRDWALYFTSVRQPAAVLSGAVGEAARRRLADQGLTVARADKAQSGDFYVLEPTAAFRPVGPGQRRAVDIDMELWSVHKSDAPAG
ncbi:MAG: carbohydate-binding domain-containing protein, partial [Actinomadura rubrobrunea]|nr:carbohydate-binding domain-containing protein [Actinomadura rubrobrunea]